MSKQQKMVPREPTEAMIKATWPLDMNTFTVDNIWQAMYDAAPAAPTRKHDCSDDAISQGVCEGLYQDRTDECLGLVEALQAVIGLCGGYDEQMKAITKICQDAITEHAAWTR